LGRVAVQLGAEMQVENRDEGAEGRAADEPLVIRATGVMVRAVQPGAGYDLQEPVEQSLVTRVHSNGNGRLAAVTAEAALSHQYSEQKPQLELRHSSPSRCYTVW